MSNKSKTPTKKGYRNLAIRLKTAKGRTVSSSRWLQRQLNDQYVILAKEAGYRSRSVYKLNEINDKFNLLKPGQKLIDLGAAPGGWSQLAAQKLKPTSDNQIVGVDLSEVEPIPGVKFIVGDFLDDEVKDQIREVMQEKVDVIVSDMAAAACGHPDVDHLRIMALADAVLEFTKEMLKTNGSLVIKIIVGGEESNYIHQLKKIFKVVKRYKPAASRADSAEIFIVAQGFK